MSKDHFNGKKRRSQDSFGRKIKAAHSKLNQLEEVEAPEKVPVLDVRFGARIPSSKLVLKLSGVAKSFAKKEVLKDFDL